MNTILQKCLQFPTRFFLICFGALLFFPMLDGVHLFDWDEINFAESAREMLITGNWRTVQINFEVFHEKPPFFIWLQALSMKYWGVNEYAARFPNAVCGVLTMMIVWAIGKELYGGRFGTYWALLFACSLLPQMYFKSGIIDPFFNLFTFLGIYFIYKISFFNEFEDRKTKSRKRSSFLFLSALFIGLAILTKGPVAMLILMLTVSIVFVWNRGKIAVDIKQFLIWLLVIIVVVLLWISFAMRDSGLKFLDDFIHYQIRLLTTQDAGHGGPFYYHILVLFFGCFPASIFAIAGFKKDNSDGFAQDTFRKWMIVLLAVVVVVFSIVQTKIIHYSSLAYFPLTFFGAYYLDKVMDGKFSMKGWIIMLLSVVGLLLMAALLLLPQIALLLPKIEPYIKDPFASEAMHAKVYWSKSDFIPGIIFSCLFTVSILMFITSKLKQAIATLLFSMALFTQFFMVWFLPRIERYSQGAMIDFIQEKATENCRIEPMAFKSYAHLFYGKQQPAQSYPDSAAHYYITKTHRLEVVKTWVDAEEVGRKNGFVFLKKRQ